MCDTEFRAATPCEEATAEDKEEWQQKVKRFIQNTDQKDSEGTLTKRRKLERVASYRHLLAKDAQLQIMVPGGLKFFQLSEQAKNVNIFPCSLIFSC